MQKILDLTAVAIAVVAIGLSVKCAKAERLTITQGVPIVQGIRQPPTAHRYYDARMPIVTMRPRSLIIYSDEAAPPNGCPKPAFRVMSGPVAERGCYGSN